MLLPLGGSTQDVLVEITLWHISTWVHKEHHIGCMFGTVVLPLLFVLQWRWAYEMYLSTVKWQNTTGSWSGEPEVTEGTWLQLMCCTPSQLRCPKFWNNRGHGVTMIFWSTPEKMERLDVHTNGCTIVDIWTDPIIHDLFVYVSMGMNVSTKWIDNKTVMGHNKHNNQKWNIKRSLEFWIGDKSENGEQ